MTGDCDEFGCHHCTVSSAVLSQMTFILYLFSNRCLPFQLCLLYTIPTLHYQLSSARYCLQDTVCKILSARYCLQDTVYKILSARKNTFILLLPLSILCIIFSPSFRGWSWIKTKTNSSCLWFSSGSLQISLKLIPKAVWRRKNKVRDDYSFRSRMIIMMIIVKCLPYSCDVTQTQRNYHIKFTMSSSPPSTLR